MLTDEQLDGHPPTKNGDYGTPKSLIVGGKFCGIETILEDMRNE